MSDTPQIPEAYGRSLADLGGSALAALQALETGFRHLHPPVIPQLRERLAPVHERLDAALAAFVAEQAPDALAPFHAELGAAGEIARDALARFLDEAPGAHPAAGVLAAMSLHARAQERFYPLRLALPPLARYFAEPALGEAAAALEPREALAENVGHHRAGEDDARGGFCLYVPERYDASRSWPLVVALHGGSGNGRDFLWTWLREARSRGCILLSPTSRGSTWALDHPERETPALREMVAFVRERWNVDPERVLLTGLSDGATFSLLAGLERDAPYTALAPVSGVLHPEAERRGLLAAAAGRRIYLVHGALDWMFPVALARMADETLRAAGADVTYREIEDLSHAYPREENAAILRWLDPSLALPGEA